MANCDYVILHGQVKNLAIRHLEKLGLNKSKEFTDELENLLNTKLAKSTKRGATPEKMANKDGNVDNSRELASNRKYKDIMEGRFDIADVVYIDRKDDGYTIFGKAAEFSTRTINKLSDDEFRGIKRTRSEA